MKPKSLFFALASTKYATHALLPAAEQRKLGQNCMSPPASTVTSLKRRWNVGNTRCFSQPEASDKDSAEDSSVPTSLFSDDSNGSGNSNSAKFGDVVQFRPGAKASPENDTNGETSFFVSPLSTETSPSTTLTSSAAVLDPAQLRKRNMVVAALSITLAVFNYFWQYTHPVEPIQILYQMEQESAPVTAIGNTNKKPTVVEFWAPWCENCKLSAPTLRQIEEEFGKDVNFVMVNADQPSAWPLIDAFGVDAIPHLALVEADGTVDTALIGPVPRKWLEQDLKVLLSNTKKSDRAPLPYQMLDVFANRPEQRRIQVEVVSKEQP